MTGGIHSKYARRVQQLGIQQKPTHIVKLKKKNLVITVIAAQKAFDKI